MCAILSVACGRTALDDVPLPPPVDAGGAPLREASSADVTAACVPGEQLACACPGGSQGVTTCTADGGLSACRGCPDVDATAPMDSGVDAACTPGTHDCAGHTPDVCSASGQWVLLAPCSDDAPLCANGGCVACSPGTASCNGNVPQICDDMGGWQPEAACAQPTPDCSMGECTCLMTMCATGCIDVTQDPNNCGACGHDCLGGGCANSTCQPVVVATTSGVPYNVASDGTNVYWTDLSGNLSKTLISGGGSTTTLGMSNGSPTGLAVTTSDAYWGTFGSLLRVPVGGGAATTLTPSLSGALTIDDENVYWGTEVPTGAVLSMPLSGGTKVTVLTLGQAQTAYSLAADGTNIYVDVPAATGSGTGSTIVSAPRQGGEAVTLATLPQSPPSIAAGGGTVYWTIQDPSLFWPLNSLVMSVSASGGTPVTLANGQSDVGPIVTDGTNVYWANNCETAGSPCSSVLGLSPRDTGAVVVGTAQGYVYGMAVDASRVFWTSYGATTGGSVEWVAK